MVQPRVRRGGDGSSDPSTRVDAPPPRRAKSGTVAVRPEVYVAARDAYLTHGTIAAVRAATGMSAEACSRLVESGEPRLHLPSLRDCARARAAEFEKGAARATRQEAHELAKTLEERARAARAAREHEAAVLGDARRSRAEEVRLVRANRVSAIVLAGVNADLLRVAGSLAKSLLRDEASLTKLSPRERMGILRTVAGIVQRTAQASASAVSMERLLMGQPTAILGRAEAGPSTEDMTPEEAEQWLALANRAFARRAARRTVVDASSEGVEGEYSAEEAVAELVEDLVP